MIDNMFKFFSGRPQEHTHRNPVSENEIDKPDIPRGSNSGFFFQEYVANVFLNRNRLGRITFDTTLPEKDRVVSEEGDTLPIEKTATGTIKISGVRYTHFIVATAVGGAQELKTLYNGNDLIIVIQESGSPAEGEVEIQFIKVA